MRRWDECARWTGRAAVLGFVLGQPAAAHADEINPRFVVAALGMGFETTLGEPRGDCITGTVEHGGALRSVASMDSPIPLPILEEKLHGPAKEENAFRVVLEGARGRFVEQAQPSKLAVSVVYGYEVSGGRAVLTGPRPSATGARWAQGSALARRAACGDHVVAEAELGGAVYAAVRFDFATVSDRERFERDTDILRSSLPNLTAKLRRVSSDYEGKVTITLSAVQRGGDPWQLGRIFGTRGESMPLLRCQVRALAACADAADGVRRYIVDPDGFVAQLQASPEPGVRLGGPVILRLVTRSYAELGIPELEAPGTGAVQAQAAEARKSALPRMRELEGEEATLRARLEVATGEEHEPLQRALDVVNGARRRLATVLAACGTSPSRCPDAVRSALEMRQ